MGVDESYKLDIGLDNKISISSETIFGALRGLESLSQLVLTANRADWYQIKSIPISIVDRPRFLWRGLMIDVARHYLSMETIYRVIDSLEYAKLNVLHLHLTDSESFPIQVSGYPQLHERGAWTPSFSYSRENLKAIVQYALNRGIRVVPEFDMPGHTFSWGKAYPEVVAKCPSLSTNLNNVALNPLQPKTYELVNAILSEFRDVFPDEYWHLGGNFVKHLIELGDEVNHKCWDEDPQIKEHLRKTGMSQAQLQAVFQNKVAGYMENVNRKMICWHELAFLNTTEYVVDKESIVQIWANHTDYFAKTLEAGYKVLISDGYYLDRQTPVDKKSKWLFADTWRDMYELEPQNMVNLTSATRKQVLGMEAAMWGEAVDDTNIDSAIWPRLAAMSERAWSKRDMNSAQAAFPRYLNFRCQVLRKRGIMSPPIRPDLCPYVYPSPNNLAQLCETSFIGFGIFLGTTAIISVVTGISIALAIYFFIQHKKVKKAWMADVFSDNQQILSSDHGEPLLKQS